ncbi:MAG: hypothetical protein O3C23_00975 [bacterium]|nr:hypothetical protein [bacterium]
MFGIELSELFLFARQLGLVLIGAASLWGFVLTRWTRHRSFEKDCLVYDWIGAKLLLPFFMGVAATLLSWVLLTSFNLAKAHEGIILASSQNLATQQGEAAGPFLFIWLLVLFFGLLLKKMRPASFSQNMEWFYGVHFLFALFFMSFFAWTGEWNKEQLFYLGHSIHSIFTLGTVLILDFLFITSKFSAILKQHVYPLFPTLSKVILVGLGIDFISVALVFNEAIQLTPKFFFMQTIIGILIINGVLLAGPLSRRMLHSQKEGGKRISLSWEKIGGIAGIISVASWSTVTLVDFFANLTLTYIQLLVFYLVLVLVLYLGHTLMERFQEKVPAFLEHNR